jgi:hypothetical protein
MINDILITGNFQHTRQFTCITLLVVHVSLCNAVTGMQFTLVNKFGEISPLVRARIVSGHLAESGQFCAKCKSFTFSQQVR